MSRRDFGMRRVAPGSTPERLAPRVFDVYYWAVGRTVGSRGFSLVELLVLVGVIAIITTVSAPAFVNYWRAATLQGGARQLTTIINPGPQVAVSHNTTVCVKQSTNKVQFLTAGCAPPLRTGPATDADA